MLGEGLSEEITETLPEETARQLHHYKRDSSIWHSWEDYFNLVHYRVMTMSTRELATIHGVDEGLEYRIKKQPMAPLHSINGFSGLKQNAIHGRGCSECLPIS